MPVRQCLLEDCSAGHDALKRLELLYHIASETLCRKQSKRGTSESQVQKRLLHSIKHLGNRKGNWSAKSVRQRRIAWWRWQRTITEFEFRRYYRMSQPTFMKLVALLKPTIQGNERYGKLGSPNGCLSPEIKVSMTLRWLAGGSYLDIYLFHGVSDAAFWNAKNEVLDAIAELPALAIWFPDLEDTDALADMAADWKEKSEMYTLEHCIGALDGLLIDLHSVRGEAAAQAARYFTRKSTFALNVQAMCDAH